MSDLSKLYPDIAVGNALRNGYSSVPDLMTDTKPAQQAAPSPEEVYFKGGGVNYDLYLGGGLLHNKLKPNELMMKWNDYLNQIIMQGGKDNWSVNYQRKF
jgi:hypothetical protein